MHVKQFLRLKNSEAVRYVQKFHKADGQVLFRAMRFRDTLQIVHKT